MFDSNNRTPRRGGYSQDANPREHNGAHFSADGTSIRPRFNATTDRPNRDGGRQRQRISRTAGAVRVDRVENSRPMFRPEDNTMGNRQFRPKQKHNSNVYSQRKRQEYAKNYEDPTKPIRLNKYLANAGICSRREADDFILAGVITVNGEVVDNLGAKVLPTD
ncbi:MAG: pseudouridine synthase, partial [Paludibacteraceae bacterium]|nr:pseudouridine synthase [Paludibacteraceae bacterium]